MTKVYDLSVINSPNLVTKKFSVYGRDKIKTNFT